MSVKVDIQDVLKSMEKEINNPKTNKIQNDALNKGSQVISSKLTSGFNKFVGTKYSTGATRDEITVQRARKTKDGRMASIGWNGPKERYRLIHLNEWGYTRKGKKYRPRMSGTVTNTLKASENDYLNTVYKELKKAYEG